MIKNHLPVVILATGLALGAGLGQARAANLMAVETGISNGVTTCTDVVCLLPDANWDVGGFSISSYDAATATVTGSGSFLADTTGTGTSTLYLTEGDGTTISDILTLNYSVPSSGVEHMTVTYQSSGAYGSLGTVPSGGTSLIETGGLQAVTALLNSAGTGTFPSNITMQAQSAVPEPSSVALLGTALLGFASFVSIRRRRRRMDGGAAVS